MGYDNNMDEEFLWVLKVLLVELEAKLKKEGIVPPTLDGPKACSIVASAIIEKFNLQDAELDEKTLRNMCLVRTSKPKHRPYPRSLSLIVSFISKYYDGWDDFYKKTIEKYNPHDGFNAFDMYMFANLILGDEVVVGWPPEKYCRLKYRGEYEFEVIKNNKLNSEIGRRFFTTGFQIAPFDKRCAYPDIIIEPFLDDDPDWELIKSGVIPIEYFL